MLGDYVPGVTWDYLGLPAANYFGLEDAGVTRAIRRRQEISELKANEDDERLQLGLPGATGGYLGVSGGAGKSCNSHRYLVASGTTWCHLAVTRNLEIQS